jgi:hypothetical protein
MLWWHFHSSLFMHSHMLFMFDYSFYYVYHCYTRRLLLSLLDTQHYCYAISIVFESWVELHQPTKMVINRNRNCGWCNHGWVDGDWLVSTGCQPVERPVELMVELRLIQPDFQTLYIHIHLFVSLWHLLLCFDIHIFDTSFSYMFHVDISLLPRQQSAA